MGIKQKIFEIIESTGEKIASEIKDSLKKQGHSNTGKGLESIEALTYSSTGEIISDINMNDYLEIVNKGVKKSKIPFGGRKTGATSSRYIQGLKEYFQTKGFSDKNALRFAFATAHKHKMEGMPTNASRRFSESGERLKFIEGATTASKEFQNTETKVLDAVEQEANHILGLLVIN